MPDNITFRTHLIGSISDFTDACDMGELVRPSILVELIVSLARYQEEGVTLCPEVYLCEELTNMLLMMPGSGSLPIGHVDISDGAIKEVLKKCAPLALDGWKIYVEGNGDFGLFRDSLNPLNIPVEETLLSNVGAEMRVVRVFQIANDCVEIRSYCGGFHNIYLSHKRETEPSPERYLGDLVETISDKVLALEKDTVRTFLKKSLREGLRESHGALIAVVRGQTLPALFSDGIQLSNSIDFAAKILERHESNFQHTTLSALGSLLKGMLNSDGILVFTRDAKLLAYNCFVKSSKSNERGAVGGARRRAYGVLCEKLNRGTYAAFIQSQDGWTDFRKVDDGQ